MYVCFCTSLKKLIRGHLRGGFLRRDDGREMDFKERWRWDTKMKIVGFLMCFLRGLINKNLNEMKVGKSGWEGGFLMCRGRL